MKTINLTQGQVTMVDDDKYEELNQFKWYAGFQPNINGFYAVRNIRKSNGKQEPQKLHRLIVNAPKGKMVDHINGDTLNNQISNLRICSNRENTQNKHSKKSSIFPGTYWHKQLGKWHAQIIIDGKHKSLGAFTSELEAFKSYLKTCKEYEIPTGFLEEKFKYEMQI